MDEAKGAAPPKFKIPPVRVPADDCPARTTSGETVYLHEGEWVEVLPVQTYALWLAIQKVAQSADDGAYEEFCEILSKRVTAWNLTDVIGDPLPQPWRNPAAIHDLQATEQMWLYQAMQGTTGGQRKNGSGGSGDTSSTTVPSRRKR